MHWHGKVVWTEGMFLRPQHFQQQDRYFENVIRETATYGVRLAWGVRDLDLDDQALQRGLFRLKACTGIIADGTPINVPGDQDPPTELDVDETIRDTIVYLAVPDEQGGKAGPAISEDANGAGRFRAVRQAVADSSDQRTGSEAEIRVGHLKLRLFLESDDRSGFLCTPIARIQEVSANRRIALDPRFIPTCVDFRASERLRGFMDELQGLLRQRGDALASVSAGPEQGTVGELANFLLLQVINRHEPLVTHLTGDCGLHPEELYKLLLGLAGELATFFESQRRSPPFERYRHKDLTRTFDPIELRLRGYLSKEFARRAIPIPLEHIPEYGLYTATIHDRTLIDTATFVLAVSADLDPAEITQRFLDQSKAGAIEQISRLVNYALPGVLLNALPVAPRQIPFNSRAVYFQLDTTCDDWNELSESGGLAIQVAGWFPNLKLELWAIRAMGVETNGRA